MSRCNLIDCRASALIGLTVTGSEPEDLEQHLASEPDPQKVGRRVWEIGWDGSVPSEMYGICNYYFVPTLFLELLATRGPNKG